jgi:uncharacterized protein YggE
MTFTRLLTPILGFLMLSTIANAQTVKVDQQNRTIEISAESSIQVVADRVTITVGYRNYGPTHEETIRELRIGFSNRGKRRASTRKAFLQAL